MKKALLMLLIATLQLSAATIWSKTTGGVWGDTLTWIGHKVPNQYDEVVINGHVTLNYSHSCGLLTINQGKNLTGQGFLYIASNFTNNGSYINSSTTYIGGNITQNGSVWQSGAVFLNGSADINLTTNYPIDCSGQGFHCAYNVPTKKINLQGNLHLKNTGFYLDGCEMTAAENSEIKIENGSLYGGDNDIIDINQNVIYNLKNAYIGNLHQSGSAVFLGNVAISGGPNTGGYSSVVIDGNVTVADTLSPHSYGTSGWGTDILYINGNLTNNGLIRGNYLPDQSNKMSLNINVSGNVINNSTMINNTSTTGQDFINNGVVKNAASLYIGRELFNSGSISEGINGWGDSVQTMIMFTNGSNYKYKATSAAINSGCKIGIYESEYRQLVFEGNGVFTNSSFQGSFYGGNHLFSINPGSSPQFTDCRMNGLLFDGGNNTVTFAGKNILAVKSIKNSTITGIIDLRKTDQYPISIEGTVTFNDSVNVDSCGTIKISGILNNNEIIADPTIIDPVNEMIQITVSGTFNNYGELSTASLTLSDRGCFVNHNAADLIMLNGWSSPGSSVVNLGQIVKLNTYGFKGSVINKGTISAPELSFFSLGGHLISGGSFINPENINYSLTNSYAQNRNQQVVMANKMNFRSKIQFYSDFSGRWYKDGELIPGQTSNTSVFTRDSLTISDIGVYHCYKTSGNLTSRKLIVDTLFHTENVAPAENQSVSSANIDFQWLPIPSANEYRIQLATNQQFTQNVQTINQIYDTTYTVTDLSPNATWFWRVSARTVYGFENKEYQWTPYTTVSSFVYSGSGIENEQTKIFALAQNYPNPFNPTTQINFATRNTGKVSLNVFNAKGEMVKELINSTMSAGNHAVSFNAESLNSGIYFYQLKTADQTITKKMILQK